MPVWRGFSFLVVASTIERDSLFVTGLSRGEPFRVGDRFHRSGPCSRAWRLAERCSLEIRRILVRGLYVTWIDGGKVLELELSGTLPTSVAEGTELSGDSGELLGAYQVLGRGTPRVFGN
jgi:hypothetical protein